MGQRIALRPRLAHHQRAQPGWPAAPRICGASAEISVSGRPCGVAAQGDAADAGAAGFGVDHRPARHGGPLPATPAPGRGLRHRRGRRGRGGAWRFPGSGRMVAAAGCYDAGLSASTHDASPVAPRACRAIFGGWCALTARSLCLEIAGFGIQHSIAQATARAGGQIQPFHACKAPGLGRPCGLPWGGALDVRSFNMGRWRISASADFVASAHVDTAKYNAMYAESVSDPDAFWGRGRQAAGLDQALYQGAEHRFHLWQGRHQVVRGWRAERLGQLHRPASARPVAADRDHLGAG